MLLLYLAWGHNVGLNGEERILTFLTLSPGVLVPLRLTMLPRKHQYVRVRESKERFLKENL